MEAVTVDNVVKLSFENVRTFCFGLIKGHDNDVVLDKDLFIRRLGEYASLYQYFAELYTLLIGRVREAAELHDNYRKMGLMDKRDCIEYCMKAVKFQYEAISRKTTILTMEDREE